MIHETTFNNLRVAVIGDVILDIYKWGIVERISPEAAAPIVNVHTIIQNIGGAGNVARNIVSLGAKCRLYGPIGNDRNGERLKELAKDSNIETKFCIKETPTISKERIMGE